MVKIKESTINRALILMVSGGALATVAIAADTVSDDVISEQRALLAKNTSGAGFGPQSPRDIDSIEGTNQRAFELSLIHISEPTRPY